MFQPFIGTGNRCCVSVTATHCNQMRMLGKDCRVGIPLYSPALCATRMRFLRPFLAHLPYSCYLLSTTALVCAETLQVNVCLLQHWKFWRQENHGFVVCCLLRSSKGTRTWILVLCRPDEPTGGRSIGKDDSNIPEKQTIMFFA